MNPVSETVAQLGESNPQKVYQARRKLQELVAQTSRTGKESDQKAVADGLAEELSAREEQRGRGRRSESRPKHSASVRRALCEFLSEVAGDAQMPALVAELKELDTREMARWALERIVTDASTQALLQAVDFVGSEFRIGVINALAARKTAEVAAALERAAADPVEQVRLAAAEALAAFPEPSHDDVISAAGAKGTPRGRSRAQKARLRLAESLHRAGNKTAAIAIYRAVANGDSDEPQKKAAQLALQQLT